MTNGYSSVDRESDRSGDATVPPFTLEVLRERAVARRRLDQRQNAKRANERLRRQKMRTAAICVGALLLMALGIYFGVAHEEAARPVESAASMGAVRIG